MKNIFAILGAIVLTGCNLNAVTTSSGSAPENPSGSLTLSSKVSSLQGVWASGSNDLRIDLTNASSGTGFSGVIIKQSLSCQATFSIENIENGLRLNLQGTGEYGTVGVACSTSTDEDPTLAAARCDQAQLDANQLQNTQCQNLALVYDVIEEVGSLIACPTDAASASDCVALSAGSLEINNTAVPSSSVSANLPAN